MSVGRAAGADDPLEAGAPRLRLASSNPHKVEELRRLVRSVIGQRAPRLEVESLRGVAGYRAPAEDGADYRANAEIKMRAAAALFPGEAVLADDSGIEVDVLGGEPGVRSNRWATGPTGAPLDGAGLNAALLARLQGVPEDRRTARMVCVVGLALPLPGPETPRLVFGFGAVLGRIAHDARGVGGFGYDAVFLLEDGRRLSEVAAAVKDQRGHRGQAVRAVAAALADWAIGAPAPPRT